MGCVRSHDHIEWNCYGIMAILCGTVWGRWVGCVRAYDHIEWNCDGIMTILSGTVMVS